MEVFESDTFRIHPLNESFTSTVLCRGPLFFFTWSS